jgi:diguanylate cyclase (GGDEF)-like protein
MDLDRFKEVNDTMGHHAGDVLLQQVAARLRSTLRASDTVARLGGDEFALLLSTTTEAPETVAAHVLRALERPFVVEGQSVAVGASLGIARYPEHGQDVDSLVKHADVAMYAAKRARGGFAVYAPEHDHHTLDRLALASELRGALTRPDELMLHYQPKLDLQTGCIAGTEALIRWQHPRRGLLGPDQFIDLAGQTGLMQPLTRWVLQAALAQQRRWQEQGLWLPVAVNLSPACLQRPELVDEIRELLSAAAVDPRGLEVEITEDAYIALPDVVANTLAQLRAMGVWVSIDDFGTGFSSLMYLQKLPVDALKIDRSFVRTMATDPGNAVIVRSIIDLGHNLGLAIVAEGVEDEATRAQLAALGCEYGQGYGLGRPQAAAQLTPRLLSQPAGALRRAA